MDNSGLLATYRKLLDLLSPREKRTFMVLLGLIVVAALAQMIGIASVLPFLAVLANPGVVETNEWLAWAYDGLGFTSQRQFLIAIGAAVFLVVVLSLGVKTLTQYAITRFATMRGFTISSRLLQSYLSRSYPWFLNRHSADLGANILVDVNKVTSQCLMPAMRLLSQGAVVFFIVTLLIAVNPLAAVVLAVLLGGSYAVLYLAVRNRVGRLGEERFKANGQRFQIAGDAFGGIKDVKLLGLENTYMRRFVRPARRLAECDAASGVISEVPRHLLEVLAFGGMLVFVLVLLATGDGTLEAVLPVLGIYAFAALRLSPALQQVYASFTALRFGRPTLDRIHADLVAMPTKATIGGPVAEQERPVLRLRERLALEGIRFRYPQAERPALRGVDMAIEARTTVGIVGGTGAGKTTVVDIVLGLLHPQEGRIAVDGVAIDEGNLRAWQNAIGYVPQQIFLTDDTVSANIAFGLPEGEIDAAAVERAARIAELHDFVVNELPNGYDTLVGERGVRLSGGQRQRIGIARALYHDPDVLILDEATSALDNLTERAVMDAVHNLGRAKTIVMIAHRLSTVRNCDVIHLMKDGVVAASGSYDDLVRENATFRAMTAAS